MSLRHKRAFITHTITVSQLSGPHVSQENFKVMNFNAAETAIIEFPIFPLLHEKTGVCFACTAFPADQPDAR